MTIVLQLSDLGEVTGRIEDETAIPFKVPRTRHSLQPAAQPQPAVSEDDLQPGGSGLSRKRPAAARSGQQQQVDEDDGDKDEQDGDEDEEDNMDVMDQVVDPVEKLAR
jgi:hypothetical protein